METFQSVSWLQLFHNSCFLMGGIVLWLLLVMGCVVNIVYSVVLWQLFVHLYCYYCCYRLHCDYYLWSVALWLLFVQSYCGYCLFSRIVTIVCSVVLWLLFVQSYCDYCLFSRIVTIVCSVVLWLLFVQSYCGYCLLSVVLLLLLLLLLLEKVGNARLGESD